MAPKDIYILTIFDKDNEVPEKCKVNDPSLPYCRIMGRYPMEIPDYVSIKQ